MAKLTFNSLKIFNLASSITDTLLSKPLILLQNFKGASLHTCLPLYKARDRRYFLQNVKAMDEGTDGEKTVAIDAAIHNKEDMFVDEKTPNLLFNGIRFCEVPVCHIKVSKNNTIIQVTDHKGKHLTGLQRTCGSEGFKNARKGTNIAGQSVGIGIATRAVQAGIKDVRVTIRGLGPGRMASIKGLTMGGLNIISVTDDTRVSYNPPKPRKVRRV